MRFELLDRELFELLPTEPLRAFKGESSLQTDSFLLRDLATMLRCTVRMPIKLLTLSFFDFGAQG